MTMELRIPYPGHGAQQPALSINIHPSNGGYKAALRSAGALRWFPTTLGVGPGDIEDLNLFLQDCVERVAGSVDALAEGWKDPDGPLAALAEAGAHAFEAIFKERLARELILATLSSGALVEVASEKFSLPWELLYHPVAGRHGITGFWGMRCVVARLPALEDEDDPMRTTPAVMRTVIDTPRPQLGLIVSDTLDSVTSIEVPRFRQLHAAGAIDLSELAPLATGNRQGGLGDFITFLGAERDLLHLACHAEAEKRSLESWLEVSQSFQIKLVDLGRRCRIGSGAFVMLNACRTGAMNPGSVFNWSSTFLKRGASGVLATEFRVLDDFAARFAEHFYGEFLAGTPVGGALLRTRRYFWRTERNPLGLGYSLYSSPDIRIQATEMSTWKNRTASR